MNDNVLHLISLSLTFPALFFCILVIMVWGKDSVNSLFKDKSPSDWLIIGVLLGFIGFFIDNLYWGVWWSLDYFSIYSDLKELLIKYGILVNIMFRQVLVIAAGYCHIKAFLGMKKKDFPIYLWVYSLLAGLIYAVVLFLSGKNHG